MRWLLELMQRGEKLQTYERLYYAIKRLRKLFHHFISLEHIASVSGENVKVWKQFQPAFTIRNEINR